MIDPRLVAMALATLTPGEQIVAPSPKVAGALLAAGLPTRAATAVDLPDDGVDAVVLLDDELSAAGEYGEGLVADSARPVRPGGLLLVSALGAVHATATGRKLDGLRAYTAEELRRALGHRGFAVELLCAPGAAAALAGDPQGPLRLELDRAPGLLDAGPRVAAVGRKARDPAEGTREFMATLPRKVVAAAVLCRDTDGRVLVVHDTFKRHWTIPGGVVDADEDPRSGAVREAWEEAGVRVMAGAILGVFCSPWPDRVVFVYEGRPRGGGEPVNGPPAHEIDAVAWVDVDDALRRLAPYVAEQVRRCLVEPGGTWIQAVGG